MKNVEKDHGSGHGKEGEASSYWPKIVIVLLITAFSLLGLQLSGYGVMENFGLWESVGLWTAFISFVLLQGGGVDENHHGLSHQKRFQGFWGWIPWIWYWLKRLGDTIGTVYGDIGTSTAYTIGAIFFGHHVLETSEGNVLGVLSLIAWTLILVVYVKYTMLVLRAHHMGEGGPLALYARVGIVLANYVEKNKMKSTILVTVGFLLIFSAGSIMAEGILTPAISLLSAFEGLVIAGLVSSPWVVPIVLVTMTAIFAFQRQMPIIGKLFGVWTTVWFFTIGSIGAMLIVSEPEVLRAINPLYGLQFLYNHGFMGSLVVLGSVTLCMTGGEALFADLGHCGAKPIRLSWSFLVMPALLLNYFGQGAFLLSGGVVVDNNVFFSSAFSVLPQNTWCRVSMIVLTAGATIIASQALITGSFALFSGAIKLSLMIRMKVVHMSRESEGQIYIPFVNWSLYVACCICVLWFQKAAALEAAYGFAVTAVMTVTSITLITLAIYDQKWSWKKAICVYGVFLVIDAAYLTANSLKFLDGAYIPVSIAIGFFGMHVLIMWGRASIRDAYQRFASKDVGWYIELRNKLDDVKSAVHVGLQHAVALVTGTRRMVELDRCVVFLTSQPIMSVTERLPTLVRVYLKRLGAMPAYTIFLNVRQVSYPHTTGEWLFIERLHNAVIGVRAEFGYMEEPNVDKVLGALRMQGILPVDPGQVAIEAGEDDLLIRSDASLFMRVLTRLYRGIMKIAIPAHQSYGLSNDARVGRQIVPITVDSKGFEVFLPEFAVGGSVQLARKA